jgi:hypothetical protein
MQRLSCHHLPELTEGETAVKKLTIPNSQFTIGYGPAAGAKNSPAAQPSVPSSS